MKNPKTPGVFVVEKTAFPNSVVEVPTSVPVFVGYTQTAKRGDEDLTGVPVRITTLAEFQNLFGAGATETYTRAKNEAGAQSVAPTAPRFYLYPALRMFFNNGGGPCWILSIGGYDSAPSAEDFGDAVWEALAKEPEPALILAPDAVSLGFGGYSTVTARMVRHCAELKSRFAILDLFDGANPSLEDPIEAFRNATHLGRDASFAAVYAPWLNTNLNDAHEVDFRALDRASRKALKSEVEAELKEANGGALPEALKPALADLIEATVSEDKAGQAQTVLLRVSPAFQTAHAKLLAAVNLLPPAGAVAGGFVRTDAGRGVWTAPANIGFTNVLSPAVPISDALQEDMNQHPLSGKAVNAIRDFPGRGVLVWGARTLDGNSHDWRYVNLRRTLIFLEQSIMVAVEAYVFAPNVSDTWIAVANMIRTFLHNQWKAGALVGATPDEAYEVLVGLGATMTANDILDGWMNVTVKVAVTRPAEFIVITFQQKMQSS